MPLEHPPNGVGGASRLWNVVQGKAETATSFILPWSYFVAKVRAFESDVILDFQHTNKNDNVQNWELRGRYETGDL